MKSKRNSTSMLLARTMPRLPLDGYKRQSYTYAIDLIRDIKVQGDFCIGAACYPEGHVECEHKEDDIGFLKAKVDAGCDFLTTQMFFDNNIYYKFYI